ncbi:hypothetical protein [Lysobacter gummosus]
MALWRGIGCDWVTADLAAKAAFTASAGVWTHGSVSRRSRCPVGR